MGPNPWYESTNYFLIKLEELDVNLSKGFPTDGRTKKVIAEPRVYVSPTKENTERTTVFQRLSQTADRLTQAPKATNVSKPAEVTKPSSPDIGQSTSLFKPKDFLTPLRPLPTRPRKPAAATITAPILSTVKVNSLNITVPNSTEAAIQTEPVTSNNNNNNNKQLKIHTEDNIFILYPLQGFTILSCQRGSIILYRRTS